MSVYYDENGNPINTGTAPVVAGASDSSDGTDSSGFLSGMSDLFQGIGAGIASGLAASNIKSTPVPTGWQFNPSTGLYVNPATGQSMTATGVLTSVPGVAGGLSSINLGGSSGILIIGALIVGAFLLFRER